MTKYETVQQFAERLGFPVEAVTAAIENEKLDHHDLGGGLFAIPPGAEEDWFQRTLVTYGKKRGRPEGSKNKPKGDDAIPAAASTPPQTDGQT
jgi:hypothetical protein